MNSNNSKRTRISNITVEPASFFYILAYVMIENLNTNLVLQKECRLNATVEPNLDIRCNEEKLGIVFASKVNSKYRSVMFLVCILYTILITCWSDEAGRRRRPLIFLPIIGAVFQSISGCLHSHFWYWAPGNAALSDAFCEALTGGIILMNVATQIYICDVSAIESRTMRLGVLITVKMFCLTLGAGAVGFLIRSAGFFYSYLVCFVLSVTSLSLALIFVKDVSVRVEKKPRIFQLLNLMRVADSFKVVFKKSLGGKRILAFILIVIYISVYFSTQGERSVLYLFLRHKFQWDERDYSLYQIYKHVGVIIGTLFCSVVLSKRFKIHDGLIGVFAAFWDTVTVCAFLFANQNWHLYIIPLFDVFHLTAVSVSVSYLSKFYHSSEYGRLNAVLNVFSLLIPLCHPVYNTVFQKTIDTFPSAFFIVSIVMDTGIFLLYYVSYMIGKRYGNGDKFEKSQAGYTEVPVDIILPTSAR